MMMPRCSVAWPLLVLAVLALAGSSSAATTQPGVYSPATYLGRDGCGLYSGYWSVKVRPPASCVDPAAQGVITPPAAPLLHGCS